MLHVDYIFTSFVENNVRIVAKGWGIIARF